MARQFIAVRFRPGDRKTYTYHFDGEPFAIGDDVKVADRSGDGWSKASVCAIVEKPPFPTKAILGKVDPAPEGLSAYGRAVRQPSRPGGLFDDIDEDMQAIMDRDRE